MIKVAVHADFKVDVCVYQKKWEASVYENSVVKCKACHKEEAAVSLSLFRYVMPVMTALTQNGSLYQTTSVRRASLTGQRLPLASVLHRASARSVLSNLVRSVARGSGNVFRVAT